MKKNLHKLFMAGALVASLGANAQTPVGTLVGNFTLADRLGTTYDLYSYLDAGKTVVIDISATWCSPCWSYHNTAALDNFYTAHGPSGANDAMVFFVEGDPGTNDACLTNTAGCSSSTQGDWVTGTPYPIIDLTSSTAASFPLDIPYYPCLYVICPNRTVYKSGVAGSIGTLTLLNSYMGDCATAASGLNAAINSYSGETEVCGTTAAKIILQNMGSTTLTSCTITGTAGATSLGPVNWTGSLATYEWEEVNLGNFTPTGATSVNVTITTSDAVSTDNSITKSVAYNSAPTNSIIVAIVTDQYGSETTWNIKNSGGTTVGSGGPWTDLGASGTTTQTPVNLTLPNDCYTFTINDAYGDGMCCSYGSGSYTVKYGTTTVVTGGSFATQEKRKFATNGSSGLEENEIVSGMVVFPNPVNNVATINFNLVESSDVLINITNSVGQVVASQKMNNAGVGANQATIDFTAFESGIYYVNITAGNQVTTAKIVK